MYKNGMPSALLSPSCASHGSCSGVGLEAVLQTQQSARKSYGRLQERSSRKWHQGPPPTRLVNLQSTGGGGGAAVSAAPTRRSQRSEHAHVDGTAQRPQDTPRKVLGLIPAPSPSQPAQQSQAPLQQLFAVQSYAQTHVSPITTRDQTQRHTAPQPDGNQHKLGNDIDVFHTPQRPAGRGGQYQLSAYTAPCLISNNAALQQNADIAASANRVSLPHESTSATWKRPHRPQQLLLAAHDQHWEDGKSQGGLLPPHSPPPPREETLSAAIRKSPRTGRGVGGSTGAWSAPTVRRPTSATGEREGQYVQLRGTYSRHPYAQQNKPSTLRYVQHPHSAAGGYGADVVGSSAATSGRLSRGPGALAPRGEGARLFPVAPSHNTPMLNKSPLPSPRVAAAQWAAVGSPSRPGSGSTRRNAGSASAWTTTHTVHRDDKSRRSNQVLRTSPGDFSGRGDAVADSIGRGHAWQGTTRSLSRGAQVQSRAW